MYPLDPTQGRIIAAILVTYQHESLAIGRGHIISLVSHPWRAEMVHFHLEGVQKEWAGVMPQFLAFL